jgi:hypothetical protein
MFTSYFANVKKLPPDLVPVSIARGSPRGFTGKKELRLAPTWAMLKLTKPEYDAAFAELLAKLDPAEIYQTLGEDAVLLCWEKPRDACHRRRVAEWLEAALSIEIPEYGFNRSACPAYDEMIWAGEREADSSSAETKSAAPSEEQLHEFGQRWASGESIAKLAKEAGMSWNRLWSELTKLGYHIPRNSTGWNGRRVTS